MTYPPQLPTVLFSALSSVDGSNGRRPRRGPGGQVSHTGLRPKDAETTQQGRGRPYKGRRIRSNLVGVVALVVVVALGVMLGDAAWT